MQLSLFIDCFMSGLAAWAKVRFMEVRCYSVFGFIPGLLY